MLDSVTEGWPKGWTEGCLLKHDYLVARIPGHPFYQYAAFNWGFHVRKAQETAVEDLALKFLSDRLKVIAAGQMTNRWNMDYMGGYRGIPPSNFTGMHIAAWFRLEKILRKLLQRSEYDPNHEDSDGRTALSVAAGTGQEDSVRFLLDTGLFNVNAGHGTRAGTALHVACSYSRLPVVRSLLEAGANVEARTERGWTALHVVAKLGDVSMILLLLSYGSCATAQSNSEATPLYRAVRSGSLLALERLLQEDGRTNIITRDGWTPLHEAVE